MALTLAAQAVAAPRVIAVDVDGVVHPVTAEIVGDAIAQARQEGASLKPSLRLSRSIFPKAHSTADLTSVKSTGFIA